MSDLHTLVVGGGIAGLAAAAEAAELGDTLILEARPTLGGQLRSERVDGYLCEHAAASVNLPADGTSTLVATTGAGRHLISADADARRRWIHYPEGLVEVPLGPQALAGSRIVSPWAKLGLLYEPFVRARTGDDEESVADFIVRRFGAEIASRVAQPVVAGVFAGQASQLSVDAAFPQLRELERDGGVLRNAIRRMRNARAAGAPRPGLASFDDGMATLPRCVGDYLGPDRVRVDTQVGSVRRNRAGWEAETDGGMLTADRLVLACGPRAAGELVGELDAEIQRELTDIPRAPVAVVYLGIEPWLLESHRGFGFLAHPTGGLRVLGAVFDSTLFPERAPHGRALVRILVGGALHPERVELTDAELVDIAAEDLGRALVAEVVPDFARVVRNRVGIPQYVLGHRDRIRRIDARATRLGHVALTGWAYRGIGVNSVVADAIAQVRVLG